MAGSWRLSKSWPGWQGGKGIQAEGKALQKRGGGFSLHGVFLANVRYSAWLVKGQGVWIMIQGRHGAWEGFPAGGTWSILCCGGSLQGRVEVRLERRCLRAERLSVHRAGAWRGGSQPEDQGGAQWWGWGPGQLRRSSQASELHVEVSELQNSAPSIPG